MQSLTVLVLLFSYVSCAKLPPNLLKCSQTDPQFRKCLTSAIDDALHKLQNGNQKLGLQTLDPLDVPSLEIGAGTGAVAVKQNYKNVKLYGYSQGVVKDAFLDFDNKKFTLILQFPKLKKIADYRINGRILLLPVYGEGRSQIDLDDVEAINEFIMDIEERNGKQYLKALSNKVTLKPKSVHFQFGNLFNGNKELSDNIHKVVNENWQEVFNDGKDGYEQAFSQINNQLANNVFRRVSINELFK